MKLIAEYIDQEIGYVTEAKGDGSKSYTIEGIFAQAEGKNRNGRIYPKAVMESAVDKYVTEQVNTKRAVGELNHPDGPTVNLDKVSHRITELDWDGNNVMGKALILDTPMGNIARALLKSGAKLGVSSRGSGNVNESGKVSDFDIVTVDIVAQPSAPDAYPKTIYESLFNMRGGAVILNTAEALTHDKSAEKHLMKQITGFINELKL